MRGGNLEKHPSINLYIYVEDGLYLSSLKNSHHFAPEINLKPTKTRHNQPNVTRLYMRGKP